MATINKGSADRDVELIKNQLDAYEADHLGADAQLYRQNTASIRIRIIDSTFAGMPRLKRQEQVWKYFASLPEDVQQQITVLLLLPPAELKSSIMNFEFDDPIPSAM